ncbi:hypothetical protein H920_05290 [Fukomys damarensis]|uniref:Uncharacterized protein n=1 Tax=Fukomys damarensis TaxID=885580 RepID=A0A091DPV0_FUKDA|nr:hypothetical protein H920_05290 [Fukomys damarensis]
MRITCQDPGKIARSSSSDCGTSQALRLLTLRWKHVVPCDTTEAHFLWSSGHQGQSTASSRSGGNTVKCAVRSRCPGSGLHPRAQPPDSAQRLTPDLPIGAQDPDESPVEAGVVWQLAVRLRHGAPELGGSRKSPCCVTDGLGQEHSGLLIDT